MFTSLYPFRCLLNDPQIEPQMIDPEPQLILNVDRKGSPG